MSSGWTMAESGARPGSARVGRQDKHAIPGYPLGCHDVNHAPRDSMSPRWIRQPCVAVEFWKAKVFGVHTGVEEANNTWDSIAGKGVTFTWGKD